MKTDRDKLEVASMRLAFEEFVKQFETGGTSLVFYVQPVPYYGTEGQRFHAEYSAEAGC